MAASPRSWDLWRRIDCAELSSRLSISTADADGRDDIAERFLAA